MHLVRRLCFGLILPPLCWALCGCGGDSDDDGTESDAANPGDGRPSMLDGPAGCYIVANNRCDCDLEEAACTEDVGVWVDDGCASCQT